MLHDLLYGWRSLRATPRLTLTAVLCAAIGLGAAIFMTTLVDVVLLSAPPMPHADRLVRVWTSQTATQETADISYPEVLDLRERTRSFDAIESASRTRLAVTTESGTERVRGESVTPGYFALIGARVHLGRLFDAREYEADADRPVLISYDLWQRRFGGRADIVGQAFRTRPASRQAQESVRTIVGVMPPGFVGTVDPDVSDFWVPVAHYEPAPLMRDRLSRATWVLARLRPGVTLDQARADVSAVAATLARDYPDAYDRVTLVAEPFGESWRARFRLSLYTLLAAAGLLLVIACTNVATLLLARLAQRENELRVRAALGAPRRRMVRQLLFESLLLAGMGGAAGITLAAAAIRAFASSGVFVLPTYVDLSISPAIAALGVALVLLTGLVFGVLPARLGANAQHQLALPEAATRVSLGRRQRRYGQVLVVAQVAFTFVLLTGAALLARTYQNLVRNDLGYRTTELLRMAVSPDPNVFTTTEARVALADDIRRAFNGQPGVRNTSVMAGVLQPWFDETTDIVIAPDVQLRDVGRHAVDAEYLSVMGMAVVSGRDLDLADRSADATGALVSQSLARRVAEATGRDAVGQSIAAVMPRVALAESFTIVGVVNDVQYHGPLQPRPADYDVYVPIERGGPGALSIAVHTSVAPASLIAPLSRALGGMAPTSPQHWISTMEEELGLQYRDARLYASLSGVYGGAAGLLAVLGIYSVLANNVARRTREIGVRMAIGASSRQIVAMVLGEGLRTLAVGVGLGVALSVLVGRLLAGLLFGVAPQDPWTFALVTVILLGAGLVASGVPSMRAARVNPLTALRQ